MMESYQHYFEMPTLPFTILAGVVSIYWLLMIIGALDLDFLDFDLGTDIDVDVNGSWLDWGLVGLRWFNLGDVPLMVWVSIFDFAALGTSLYFDQGMSGAEPQQLAAAILRSVGVGLLAAKVVTQPLKGKLKIVEPNRVEDLLGRTCVVTTVEATEEYGQAQCRAEGAPLLLNIKTTDGPHPKGTVVEIVDYEPRERVYFVRGVDKS